MHRYEGQQRLGRGNFAEAILAKSDTGPCVLKCIQLGAEEEHNCRALREVRILKGLRHPNILRIQDCFLHYDHLVIVTEYCDAGDLETLIKMRKKIGKSFCEEAVLGVFVQVSQALYHIHSQGAVHRDLKSSNIFMTNKGAVKVGDFGVARPLGGKATEGIVGTIHHLSPEVCDGGPHSKESDCWALGVFLHELCALKLPFAGSNVLVVSSQILEGRLDPLPKRFSAEIRDLRDSLLCKDLEPRATAHDVLALPLLKRLQRRPDVAELPPKSKEELLERLRYAKPFQVLYGQSETEGFLLRQLKYKRSS